MKRKYYMRGLGIGIAATAILFSVLAPKKPGSMTDEQAIARAKELGYILPTDKISAEEIGKIKDNLTPAPTAVVTDNPKPSKAPAPTGEISEPLPPDPPKEPDKPENYDGYVTPAVTGTAISTVTVKPTTTLPGGSDTTESYTITISKGMGSQNVAALLKNVGAIESLGDFDAYLREKKLAERIKIGTFTIPSGADFETIASIITK